MSERTTSTERRRAAMTVLGGRPPRKSHPFDFCSGGIGATGRTQGGIAGGGAPFAGRSNQDSPPPGGA